MASRGVAAAAASSRALTSRAAVAFLATATVLLGFAAVQWPPRDPGSDLLASLPRLPLPVLFAVVVVPLSAVVHYVLAGVTLWAASGTRLPLRTATRAQLAAAAANRLVPNGVAGAVVNLRCLQCSGTGTAQAVAAMAALGVVGGLTDVAYTALLAATGPAVGLGGGAHAFATLAAHGIGAGRSAPWALLAVAGALVVFLFLRRHALSPRAAAAGVRRALLHVASLLRRPHQLLIMSAASLGTTAALSIGFATTVLAVGHGQSLPAFATLLVVYLVGAAVGGATPLPAVVGVTEAALVAGLVLFGVPTAVAVVATVLFRAVAFWLPVPFGVMAAKRLRTASLL